MNVMKLFLSFIAIMVLAFFAIGFADTVQQPTNATALAQYNNTTQAVEIAGDGMWATMLLLMLIMVLSVLFILVKAVKKR